MLGQDSEDEIWWRFVFELVILPKEVTLVSRTQPSGPLCLWQCLFLFSYSSSGLGDCQAYSPAGDAYEPHPLEEWHVSVPMTILHLCVELLYLYLCSWFSICALNVVSIVLYPTSWSDTRKPLWLSYPLVSNCPKFQLQRRSSHHNSLVLLSTWSSNSSHDLIVLSFSPQYLSK